MRDADWSRPNLLRSDWLGPTVAMITTCAVYLTDVGSLLLHCGNMVRWKTGKNKFH